MMVTRRPSPTSPATRPGHVKRYGRRIFDEKKHDPYQVAGKYPEPTHCRQCGAVYHGGRWRWGEAPEGSQAAVCPACRRIHDKLSAGSLILDGPFVATHRTELIALIQHEAEHERLEHPLNRIMQIEEHGGRIEISTTDIHLPQRMGEALKRAHHGELTVQYGEDEYSVRLRWQR